MGQDIKTFKFGKDSVLCVNHFHWRPAHLLKRDSKQFPAAEEQEFQEHLFSFYYDFKVLYYTV